jgi:Sensors of blue-light using FAD
MFSLTYVSSAIKPLSLQELRELLEQCNADNRRREVTGMLLYRGGNFMQVLEGEESTVRSVHQTINGDLRHTGLITLLRRRVDAREFPAWSMGFKDLGSDLDNPEGYSEFLSRPLTAAALSADPTAPQRLLESFRRTCNS